jgi:aminomethyltransferase
MTSGPLRATPFLARLAEANRRNAWENRNGFTLASGDPREALAARFGVVLADVSWHWRASISGVRAGEFVSRLLTRDASRLRPGEALKALWLNDAGGVRGIGTIARLGLESFGLVSAVEDFGWIADAAALYGVAVRDVTEEEGVLTLLGPTSGKVLAAAGLEVDLEPLALRKFFWRGLDVTLSRLGDGYELSCAPDDALIVWDRIVKAGRPFALCPAGQSALDVLDLESGIVRPGRDFVPARDGFSSEPSPQSLGLISLVDRDHAFNGRAGYLAAGPDKVLTGILFDSETPAPQTVLTRGGLAVGRTLGSLVSPALRRAIALAVLDADAAAPGTALTAGSAACRTTALPFLPTPAPIGSATENPPPAA